MKHYLLSSKTLGNCVVLGLLGLWFIVLGPTAFGGPAAYIEVSGHSMDGTYKTGDLILTHTKDTYAKGDIIAFRANKQGAQVIHRIIGGNGVTGYSTQGDNNPDPDPWHPKDKDVVGQAWHRFEGKAWIMHLPRQPWFAGLSAGLLTLLVLGWDARPRRSSSEEVPELEPVPAGGNLVLVPQQRTDSTPSPTTPSVRRSWSRSHPEPSPAEQSRRTDQ